MLITETLFAEIEEILNKYDSYLQLEEFVESGTYSQLVEAIESYVNDDRYKKFAVLGIDIYRYSHYPEVKQFMIPVIFKFLYDSTVANCVTLEPFLFQQLDAKQLEDLFISTGDGGFQIFPTPLHAFIFTIYFEANVRSFNSFSNYPKLRDYVGELSLRYSITLDKLFHFNHNFFGPGIITNARVLSKDHLNRFLIDANSHNWFLNKTAGIESLLQIDLNSLAQIGEFKTYDATSAKKKSLLFPLNANENHSLRLLNVQKVGLLDVKGSVIDIHSVFVQAYLVLVGDKKAKKGKPMILSVGNTNTSGI
jgi:hypothetical protein